ncbi:MAG: hypothetical protein ACE5E5_15775, partial [Phycisphaerae bacterium]
VLAYQLTHSDSIRRCLPGIAMTREEELVRQGWEKRTTYDEPRLSEMAEMYAELGLEVRIEPFDPAVQPDCAECMRQQPERYKTIYVRKATE